MILEYSRVLLLVVLAVAVITDVRTGKIKNWLTLPAIAAGLIVHLTLGGIPEFLTSFYGFGVMAVCAMILWSLGILGGGDVKLLGAVGALAGLNLVASVLLYGAIAGGILAIIVLVWRRRTKAVTKKLAQAAWMRLSLRVGSMDGIKTGMKIPYSIAIAAGTVAAMLRPF